MRNRRIPSFGGSGGAGSVNARVSRDGDGALVVTGPGSTLTIAYAISPGDPLTVLWDVGLPYTVPGTAGGVVPVEFGVFRSQTVPGWTVDLAIATGDDSYEVTVTGGAFDLTIGGVTYALDTADILGHAPIILADMEMTGGTSVGNTRTAAWAPIVYDPDGGVPVLAAEILRGISVVETGLSRVLTNTDILSGLTARQTAINGFGQTARDSEMLAASPYTEQALHFTGTQGLAKTTGIASAADSVLIHLSWDYQADAGPFISTDTYKMSYNQTTNGQNNASLTVYNASGQLVPGFAVGPFNSALLPGERGVMLAYFHKSGAWRTRTFRDGVQVRLASGAGAPVPDGTQISTNLGLFIGRRDADWLIADIFDLRIWTNVTVAALDDVFVGQFMRIDGTTENPIVANTALGPPAIQMPTNPTQANNLVNLGTSGNFTSKSGTFA